MLKSSHFRIFLGMLLGVLGGLLVKQLNLSQDSIDLICKWVKPLGDIFIRFIFMMVIPLVISALAIGVADLGDVSKLGRLGAKMLGYTLIVTGISVAIGIGMAEIFQPGVGLDKAKTEVLIQKFSNQQTKINNISAEVKSKSIGDVIVQIVPKNPLEDMVNAFNPTYSGGGLLAVMFFALLLGIVIKKSKEPAVQNVKSFLEGLYSISMDIIGIGMKLAPIGVSSLLFVLTVNLGIDILTLLCKYVLVVIFALAIHQFGTYSLILKVICKKSPLEFFKAIKEVMITAFSTSSSNASLPVAIKVTKENLGISKEITHFVLTIGSAANQNGTALYEGITVLFLAQVFGVHLGFAQQLIVVVSCVLAGVGTAGVPGGSLPVIMLIAESVGVPGAGIGLIYGVDRILDMSRTVLNVTGDITAAVYIETSEHGFPNQENTSVD